MGDGGRIDQLVLLGVSAPDWLCCVEAERRTGTFFCDRITAQSLPRTAIDMMFAAVIALKAYSGQSGQGQLRQNGEVQPLPATTIVRCEESRGVIEAGEVGAESCRTDLVQSSLIRKDRDVSVEACAAWCRSRC